MNVAFDPQKGAAMQQPFCLPPMQLIADGLESVDTATLRQSLDPIWKSLESLDAVAMLDLKRVAHGATVAEGYVFQ